MIWRRGKKESAALGVSTRTASFTDYLVVAGAWGSEAFWVMDARIQDGALWSRGRKSGEEILGNDVGQPSCTLPLVWMWIRDVMLISFTGII